jgi:hypothetical protein
MAKQQPENNSEILFYTTEDGLAKVEVRLENETVWLSQAQMVDLFQTTKQNISLHIRNIFSEGELQEDSVVKEYLTTAKLPWFTDLKPAGINLVFFNPGAHHARGDSQFFCCFYQVSLGR